VSADKPDEQSAGQPPGQSKRPWPTLDPKAIKDKQFMLGGAPEDVVVLKASDGAVTDRGAPATLFSRIVEHAGAALRGVGNMLNEPVVLGASSGSMVVAFGDQAVATAQTALPYRPTVESGRRMAEIVELDGDDLYGRVLELGQGAARYVELAQFVHSEGIVLDWFVGQERARLTPDRAGQQYQSLSAPPEEHSREMIVDGLLYRAIYDGPGYGRVGLRLSRHSPLPPRRRGRTVVLEYRDREIEDLVLHSLIGQPVIATVNVTEYAPFTNVLGELPPYPVIREITRGRRFELMDMFAEEDDEFDGD
jgi:hypothetical protein